MWNVTSTVIESSEESKDELSSDDYPMEESLCGSEVSEDSSQEGNAQKPFNFPSHKKSINSNSENETVELMDPVTEEFEDITPGLI